MMWEKSTEELAKELFRSKDVASYLKEEKKYLVGSMTLAEYIKSLLEEKKLNSVEVRNNSGIDKTYVYEIFIGKKKNVSRDKLLLLAFAMGLNLEETQRLLQIGGRCQLYSRDQRDAVIMFCIYHGNTVLQTEERLGEMGFDSLFEDERQK